MNTLTKEQWIEELYQLLCKSHGAPKNESETTNLREWASGIYDWALECEDGNHSDIISPQDAHDEEMAAGA